ncbi:hypothetical protein GCM10027610_008220 [Dactylosporangium cerinum]
MVFAGLVVVAVAVVHWYLWLRLVRATTGRPRVRRAGAWVVGALGVLFAVTAVGNRALPRRYEPALERVVGWPGYVWLALAGYLVLALVVLELPAWLAQRAVTRTTGPADQERRLLIGRSVAIVAGLAATGVTATGMVTALGPPTTRRVRIPLAKLPRGMDGTRIALVSDVHLGAARAGAHRAGRRRRQRAGRRHRGDGRGPRRRHRRRPRAGRGAAARVAQPARGVLRDGQP